MERPTAVHPAGEAGRRRDPAAQALAGRQLAHRQASARGTCVNESIHRRVLQRFGERVIELCYGRSHTIAYRPRNLAAALPERSSSRQRSRKRASRGGSKSSRSTARSPTRPTGTTGTAKTTPRRSRAPSSTGWPAPQGARRRPRGARPHPVQLVGRQQPRRAPRRRDRPQEANPGGAQQDLRKTRQGLLRQSLHRRPQPRRHDLAPGHEPLGQGR